MRRVFRRRNRVEAIVVAPGVARRPRLRLRPVRSPRWPCALAAGHSAERPVDQGATSVRSPVARRIVVVDDEPSVRMICRFNLAAAGMEVREAVDGSEALSTIREEVPDLVLLDVMMPNLDGWEVARALQGDPRTRELPIVFLTARAEQTDRARAAELGAVGYVLKPFDPVALPSTLESILERLARGERDALRRAVREGSDD